MKPITAIIKEKGGAKTYPCNEEVTVNADGSGGPVSIAKQVRKAKNPATGPTNKVTESYDEKRSKRRGSGNYLPKVKEPLQNRGVQSNPAKERQRKRAIERESVENKRRENSPLQKKDACYSKVKSRYKKWPSAYASGALVKCRKVGAANWGNSSPAKQTKPPGFTDKLYIKAEKLQDKAGAKARGAAIAVDEGRDGKANRLYKRAAKLENRGIKIEDRETKRRKKHNY